MTTADVSVAVPTTARSGASWLERWSPLGGLLFVIGAVALALSPAGGETGETAAEVVSFARSNDAWMVAASIFGLAALVLTAWFVAGLYTRLRKVGTSTEAVLALVGGGRLQPAVLRRVDDLERAADRHREGRGDGAGAGVGVPHDRRRGLGRARRGGHRPQG